MSKRNARIAVVVVLILLNVFYEWGSSGKQTTSTTTTITSAGSFSDNKQLLEVVTNGTPRPDIPIAEVVSTAEPEREVPEVPTVTAAVSSDRSAPTPTNGNEKADGDDNNDQPKEPKLSPAPVEETPEPSVQTEKPKPTAKPVATSKAAKKDEDLPLELVGDVNYVSPAKEHPTIMEDCPVEDRLVSPLIKAKGYGLSNQLISFAGLFAFAVRSNRTIYLTKTAARVPLSQLVNLSSSYFPKGIRICTNVPNNTRPAKEMKTILRKVQCGGMRCFKLVDRIAVDAKPIKVMHIIDKLINASNKADIDHVELWDMFMRYPYAGEVNAATLPSSFICGLSFPNTTMVPFNAAIAGLQAKCNKGEYVTVHLRLELDAVSMLGNRKLPTIDDVYGFFTGPLATFAREHNVSCVLICVGDISAEFEAIIDKASNETGILFSRKTTFLAEGAIASDPSAGGGVYYGKWVPVTSSVGATVDLMLMERAKAAIIGAFSSFALSVYSRRCGGVGCSNNSNVFVYDMYLDGSFTDIRPYACNQTMGTAFTGPPHLVAPPEPENRFFFRKFDFSPDSPLFTNSSRNANRKRRTTVDEPHWVAWKKKPSQKGSSAAVKVSPSPGPQPSGDGGDTEKEKK